MSLKMKRIHMNFQTQTDLQFSARKLNQELIYQKKDFVE